MEGIAMDVKTKQIYLVTDTNEKKLFIYSTGLSRKYWNKK